MSLPPAFVARLNRRTRVYDDGRMLVGGTPTRVLYLKKTATRLLATGTLRVTDAVSAALADRLLEAGLADPVVADLPDMELASVTVVIPVRDRPQQLDRLLRRIAGDYRTVVVDDCSRDPRATAAVATAHGAEIIVLPENLGPAGARNAGLRRVATPYVAFVDSDVVPDPETIPLLLRHFHDPRVALAAPRIVSLDTPGTGTWIARYEKARSSLDLGPTPSIVRPRAPVAWVPGACLVGRVDALGDGFTAALRAAEDVDLVWRLACGGWRVRYDPAILARHEHRHTIRQWLSRKVHYGTGAQVLAQRGHGDNVAPAVLAPWSTAAVLALTAQRWWSLPAAATMTALASLGISKKVRASANPAALGARLAGSGLAAALSQASALVLRHWWPAAAAGSLVSRRMRRLVILAGAIDALIEYHRLSPELDPVRFTIARRLDDLAYGTGLWLGVVRGRSPRPLVPRLSGRPRTPRSPASRQVGTGWSSPPG